ncbi:MAG: hypothetical protein A2571_00350 [Candidatus Vogelbacteria bacterium RIFOXYD1_FULL_44_32]|uniref:DUF350 domain-containing protein n=1 Tax=Candidatus Vogelbacteria bacterium RIFOXYD1_FULL_44_32 TaxID=1802438 RepID=A0A1G2QFP2_9BACT|nr:MAG: hypothetical protein A2571_00350 [Candidatus Vogelbacteria bacterium RIFOXYD1_FULL_44_32]
MIFTQYLITFGWALTGAVSMAVALSVALKIFSLITPIDEWEEIKKGNLGMAIILASVIIGIALVVGLTVMA